jgi:hypothetical protein
MAGRHTEMVAVALRVVAIDTLLLVSHYALQGVRLRLFGRPWRAFLDELALPGVIAEASLMPIGVVLVLLYDPDQPLGFLLLSLTYLLINLVFSRRRGAWRRRCSSRSWSRRSRARPAGRSPRPRR